MAKKLRALVIAGKYDYARSLSELINETGLFEECIFCTDGHQAMAQTLSFRPDLILLDLILTHTDGFYITEFARSALPDAKIIIYSMLASDYIISHAISAGADYYITKPASRHAIKKRIFSLFDQPDLNAGSSREGSVSLIMHKIGIPPGSKGFQYLRTAIMLVLGDPSFLHAVTTRLYPEIAKMYNSTPTRTERNMRHAIEAAWTRGNVEYIQELFGYSIDADKGKPTNSAFIATIADAVRIDELRLD